MCYSISVIPLVITGLSPYTQSKSILSKKLTITITQTLTEINHGLSDYINTFSNMVSMTSTNFDFVNVNTGDNNKYVPGLLKDIKKSNKDILDISYGTASGKFNTYPNDKMPAEYNATSIPWYKQALEHKDQVIITPAYKDVGTGNNVITLARTVERSGQVVGVVEIDLTLTTLTKRMESKKVGTTGYVFISDVSGNILSHPQKNLSVQMLPLNYHFGINQNQKIMGLFSTIIIVLKALEYIKQMN